MRVAVNAEQLLYRSPGGIGRYTAQILAGLPGGGSGLPGGGSGGSGGSGSSGSSGDSGDSVVPFTARHPRAVVDQALAAVGVHERAEILSLPRPVLYDAWLRLAIPRLPTMPGCDLVHAPSVAVPPHPRIPLVVTVHDVAPELFPETFPRRGRRFHHRGLEAAARRADLVLTVSAAAATEIVDHSHIGAERIRVVHNGVAPLTVGADRRSHILRALGLASRPFVLWVGSLEPRKGVGTAVAAMAELRKRGAGGSKPGPAGEARLVLAGYDGWLGEGLVDDGDRAALGDALVQLGRVDEETLWALYGGASVFVFPSVYEGFGLPAVEAMSQATAVVASDIEAVREVTAGAARLVPPGSKAEWATAIADLLDDDSERARLGGAGQARSRELTVDSMISGIRAAYRELVGN